MKKLLALVVLCAGCMSAEVKDKVVLFTSVSDGAARVATVGVELADGTVRPATYDELVDLLVVENYDWHAVGYALDLNPAPSEPVLRTASVAPVGSAR